MYPGPDRPATKVCHYFVKEWIRMGHEVLVVHMRACFPSIYQKIANVFPNVTRRYLGAYLSGMDDSAIKQYEIDGVPVYALPLKKVVPHARITRKCVRETVRFIETELRKKDWTPDAIVGHFVNPQLELIPRLKTFFPSARTSLVLHSSDTPAQIRRCAPCDYRKKLMSFDCIGYRSSHIRDVFTDSFGTWPHLFYCYSGAPAEYLGNKAGKAFGDGQLRSFLYVGQLIDRKYPKEVIQSLSDTYASDFSLVFVGKKDCLYNQLSAYVEANRLKDQVSFTGEVPREDIIRYYDKAECFVMISRDETFGLVYLEAMSRGCLVIAARNEGMDGIIRDGENGFLCEAGNKDELSSILRRINGMTKEEKEAISRSAVLTAHTLTESKAAEDYYNNIFKQEKR